MSRIAAESLPVVSVFRQTCPDCADEAHGTVDEDADGNGMKMMWMERLWSAQHETAPARTFILPGLPSLYRVSY